MKVTKDIELELENEVLLKLTLQAHELDLTLNEHMVNIITAKIADLEALVDERHD